MPMTAILFFQSCRNLVQVRWAMYLKRNGAINLIHVTDYLDRRFELSLVPIVAVAKDRFGNKIYDPYDVHFAAESLELSKQNATLILAASFSDAPPDKRVREVREEILSAVSHRSCLIDWYRG